MRAIVRRAALALAVAALVASAARAGEQYALLVAVQDYPKEQFNALQYTRNDILEFRQALLDSGFRDDHIVVLHDRQNKPELLPEIKKIRKQLDALLAVADRDDTLIVALSGHGVDMDRHSYFCPLDGEVGDKTSLLDLDDLYAKLKDCKAQRKLLLADCCRNDPLSKTNKGVRPEVDLTSLSRPQARDVPEGVVALFSCSAGETSREDADLKHGVFFYHVIKGWRGDAADKDGKVTLDGVVNFAVSETQTYVRTHYDAAVQRPQKKNEFSGAWVLSERPTAKPIEAMKLWEQKVATGQPAFTHDGARLAIGVKENGVHNIKFWDAASGQELDTIETRLRAAIHRMAFGPGDKTLVTASDDRLAYWGVAEKAGWQAKRGAVVGGAAVDSGENLTCCFAETIERCDRTAKSLWKIKGAGYNWDMAASPDGKSLAFAESQANGSGADNVLVLDADKGTVRWSAPTKEPPTRVAFNPGGDTVAAVINGSVKLFTAKEGKEVGGFKTNAKDGLIAFLAYSPDGKLLATSGVDGVHLWDAATFADKGTIDAPGSKIWELAFSPDGKRLATVSSDGTLKVWDLNPKK